MSAVDALRSPPMDVAAEQQVIGSVMIDERSLAKVSDWLSSSDFYRADHQAVWGAILELAGQGKPVDVFTVMDVMGADDNAEVRGLLLELNNTQASSANIVAHAEIVLEKSRLRRAIDAGTRLANAAFNRGSSASDVVANALHELSLLTAERHTGLQPIAGAVKSWWKELLERSESGSKFSGRMTPWRELNELTLGLKPAELDCIAARPGMGKSVMGFMLAAFDALRGGRPAVFSLEMSKEEFVQRSVSSIGRIPHEWLRSLDPKDASGQGDYWGELGVVVPELQKTKLLIDDTPSLTIDQICARAKRAHMQEALTMVIIDHLHIVKLKGGDNLVHELGGISRAGKALAKYLRCPVIMLAQLNRGNTQRTDKRPTMADLRGSGEIEQDCDNIWLIHRDDYYDPDTERKGVVDIVVGKGRNAPPRPIALKSRLDEMRFEDWEGPLPERESSSKPSSGIGSKRAKSSRPPF